MKRGQLNIMSVMIMLVIGVIGLTVINGLTTSQTTPETATNESLGTVTSDTTYTLNGDCLVGVSAIRVNGSAFTNYTDSAGVYGASTVTLGDLGADNNSAGYIDYTYGCNYNQNSIARVVIDNIPVLFAVALLLIGVGWAVLR